MSVLPSCHLPSFTILVFMALVTLLAACSDNEEGKKAVEGGATPMPTATATLAGTNGAEAGTEGGTNPGGSPSSGENTPAAGAWKEAFVDKPIVFSCRDTEEALRTKKVPGITHTAAAIYVGYRQVAQDNKDPIAVRFDGGKQTWCKTDYETSGDDQAAYGLAWDGGAHFYAAFSATGTQGPESGDFRRFAKAGWFTGYGFGGGPKIAVLARIAAQGGTPDKATFLRAQTSDGRTNSLAVKGLKVEGGKVAVTARSSFSPFKTDKTPFACGGGTSPFEYTVTLPRELGSAITATAELPCK